MELFSQEGLAFLTRWLHVLAGITWIGLLYYFNVVQVPAFAAYGDEGKARTSRSTSWRVAPCGGSVGPPSSRWFSDS